MFRQVVTFRKNGTFVVEIPDPSATSTDRYFDIVEISVRRNTGTSKQRDNPLPFSGSYPEETQSDLTLKILKTQLHTNWVYSLAPVEIFIDGICLLSCFKRFESKSSIFDAMRRFSAFLHLSHFYSNLTSTGKRATFRISYLCNRNESCWFMLWNCWNLLLWKTKSVFRLALRDTSFETCR